MPFTKENAKENAYKSQKSWDKNGRKARGFAKHPELAREAALKSTRKARENKARDSESTS